jgi:flagellar basal-body rod modification protein FlgD
MVQFVGKDISFQDNSFHWDRKTPTTELEFSLDGDAQGVSVLVQDENGKSVRTIEIGQRSSGKNKVVFDGLDDNGNPLDTGNYTFTVTALDANEAPVKTTTRASGRVTAVTFEAGYPELILTDGRRVDLGKVLEVKKPSTDVLSTGSKPAAEDDKGTEHSPIDKD